MYLRFVVNISAYYLLISASLEGVSGTKRDLRCTVSPGLYNSSESVLFNLVHIIANNSNDAVHFLWSSYNLPSVVVARTSNEAELVIDYEKLKLFHKGAITFSEEPYESIGLTFKELWEYSDTNDNADLSQGSLIHSLNMVLFEWTDINETLKCSASAAEALLKSSSENDPRFSQGGTFDVQFLIFGEEIPANKFPHLIFTGNSTQVKVIFNNILPNVTKPRYATELHAFSSQSFNQNTWRKGISETLNDEYSPGVFKRIKLSPPCDAHECDSFLFWRPVCYTGPEPTVANSSVVKISDFQPTAAVDFQSIAEVFFYATPNVSVIRFNVSFGTTNDGFYSKTRYLSWTLMTGTGQAIIRGLSFLATILIICCLSFLGLFMLGSGLYVLCQHWKKKDDDLLLSDGSIN